ncbi:6-phospho-alpha-glucosidase [Anaerococcus sp. AGMB00486]|uniref:6-phospho-alpha-glucosidase n=1 Tax=Anaerococcus faecalis TaxID=2742993 RepID=A0ABX2NAS4_9FIRM|nr:6-phospho-alpha-glucosidase [Anaerococcus faecalis]NVF11812.1 6-phospho-alpha-glucosidase [Anaerococcus faecalis]
MSVEKKKIKVTIAGAGSGYTPGMVLTLLKSDELDVNEIRLYDNDSEKNKDMGIIIDFIIKNGGYSVKILVTEDPKVAFAGIDFVFSQIRVGKIEMREKDEKIPLKYGLVGQETCGLGGFSYGMRSMKGFSELVELIQMYAPNAWILNYTNPETIVAETVRRKFPKAKIINACDMTIGIEEIICDSFGYDRKNWIQEYYGLNHFGWYKSIYDISKSKDVMPEIIDKIKEIGFNTEGLDKSWALTYQNMRKLVKDFPENIPNNYLEYYLYSEMIVEESDINYTRANQIMDGRLKKIKDTVKEIKNNPNLDSIDYESDSHGQYIVDIATSLLYNKNNRFILIVENMGAIPNLRFDATVEVPCYVNSKGIEPIRLGFNIPDFHKGLMEAQVASEKLLVDAHFENSYQKALEAFALNQTVPNALVAKKVLDEFIEANGDYWVELR